MALLPWASERLDADGLHDLEALGSILQRCPSPERDIDHERNAADVDDPQQIALTGPETPAF